MEMHWTCFLCCVVNAVISIPICFLTETARLPSVHDTICMTVHGVSTMLQFPMQILAVARLNANTVTLVLSSSTALMLVSQYTVLASIHPGNRNAVEVVGVVLVVLGSAASAVRELCAQAARGTVTKKEDG